MAGRLAETEPTAEASDLLSNLSRLHTGWWLALVALITLIAQAPVLGHYFFGDDFVPLADIASRDTGGYLKALFLLEDETPNWRFLTGLFYLVAYKALGLNAVPYFVAAVAVHIGTAVLIFHFVRLAAKNVWPALIAAVFFAATPASVPTVGQVTAMNNVLGSFLLMLSLVLVLESFDREPRLAWATASVLAFAAAIASNESIAVLALMPALVAVWRAHETGDDWLRRGAAYAVPFALLGLVALAGFAACQCTEAAEGGLYGTGSHVFENTLIYLGRLLYPVGQEPLGDVGLAHGVAGAVVVALALIALVRGSNLTRIAVVFLALALVPYLPLKLWSAPRYVYLASIPFSMLAGLLVMEAGERLRRASAALPAVATLLAVGVLGLFVWQTWSQNEVFDDETRPWEALVTGVGDALPSLPPETTVYLRGGELTDPLFQCVVLPAVGEVVWGNAKLFTLPADSQVYAARPGFSVFLLDDVGGVYEPAALPEPSSAGSEALLLPHVPPEASGNLCLADVPGFPER